MTKAMPFLQKTILLSYDPRPFAAGVVSCLLGLLRSSAILLIIGVDCGL